MTEHFLQTSHVRAVLQHMRCKAVPQGVWGDVFSNSCLKRISFQHFPEPLPGEHLSLHIHEQNAAVFSADKAVSCVIKVIFHRFHTGMIDGNDPFFCSVMTDDISMLQIKIFATKADQLRDTHAGRVKQLKHGAVPCSFHSRTVRSIKKQTDLFNRKDQRRFFFNVRRFEFFRRIFTDLSPFCHITEKSTHRSHTPGNRGGRVIIFFHVQHIRIKICCRHKAPVRNARLSSKIVCQLRQISSIRNFRILGSSFNAMYVIYKCKNCLFHCDQLSPTTIRKKQFTLQYKSDYTC